MEKPTVDTPVASYREHAAFTLAAVAADPEVSGMEGGLEGEHEGLKQLQHTLEDQEELAQRKLALFRRADGTCDDLLRSFELHLYDLVKKKRGDERYRRYFKTGLRAVTEAEPRKTEPAVVAAMIVSLEEDLSDPALGDLAKKFAPLLTGALAQVKATEQALTKAEAVTLHLHDQKIPAAKLAWIDEYVKLHGALRAKLPREPARVERYFLPFRKERKKVENDGPTNGAPIPDPPGAPPA